MDGVHLAKPLPATKRPQFGMQSADHHVKENRQEVLVHLSMDRLNVHHENPTLNRSRLRAS